MKKYLSLLLLMMVLCGKVKAQVLIALFFGDKLNTGKLEFGLVVSPSFTDITNIESKTKAGLNLGLYFNIKLSNRFFIHPEVYAKSTLGAEGIPPYGTGSDTLNSLFSEGSIQRRIRALGLVVAAQYRITDKLYVEAGPQANWMLKAKDIYEGSYDGNELTYTVPVSDMISTLDFGITGGIGYRLRKEKGVSLCIRYYAGLTDIWKPEADIQSNSMWTLNIGIPIGSSKAASTKPSQSP